MTSVETSPDLRAAKVHVSVLGTEEEREATLAGLRSSHGVLQSKIAAETRMKRTPTLTFHYDETVEQGMRISQLLDEEEPMRSDERGGRRRPRSSRSRPSCARATASCSPPTRGPMATRSARCSACTTCSRQLGKDSVMFMAAKEFPLPIEYRFLPLEEVFHEPPADMADRTVVFLDCGNIDRMPVDFLADGDNFVINIDHHHDNTLFGDVNLVDVDASCTAEIVYELAVALDAEITPEMASALYVGLVTDTGKFMYENTNAHTHRIAAELIDAGVDVDDTYRRLYEHVPIEKLRLVSRALEGIQRHCDDRLVAHLHHRRRLRGDRRRRGDDRGHHRPPALDRGCQGRGADPRPRRPRPRRAQGQPALQRAARSTSRRSPASTAAAATSAPPASPPISS